MPEGWTSSRPPPFSASLPTRRSRPRGPSATPSARSHMPPRSSPKRLAGGGRLAYAAAGSSGLMALADALELPGTYGIPRERIVILFAGGAAALHDLAGAPEDDAAGAHQRGRRCRVGQRRLPDRGLGQRLDALCGRRAGGGHQARRKDHRHRQQCRLAAARTRRGRRSCSPRRPRSSPARPAWAPAPRRRSRSTCFRRSRRSISAMCMTATWSISIADNIKLRGRAARIVAAVAGCDEEAAAQRARKDGWPGQAGDPARRGRGRHEDCARIARRDRPKTSPGAVETRSSRGEQAKG